MVVRLKLSHLAVQCDTGILPSEVFTPRHVAAKRPAECKMGCRCAIFIKQDVCSFRDPDKP